MVIGLDASRANVTNRTGTERYAWEVIRRLLNDLPDHQIRLYVREALLPDWPSLGNNVKVCVLRWPPGVLWSHLRLSWELLWHAPEVLFVPADTVPIIHPRNTVTTIHDVAFERFPELYRGKTIQRKMKWLRPLVNLGVRIVTLGKYGPSERDYHRWSVRHALRSCRTILTVSEFTKREIVELFKVAPEKISVTPLGIAQASERQLYSSAEISKTLVSFGIQRPYFFFVGRLEVKKNILLLVQSYHQYRRQTNIPIDLVLIGAAGYGWDEVASYIKNNNLSNVIHVLGWQLDAVSDQIHAGARALVFISKYEGFGIPAVDSLVLGVPVLASHLGSLPEVLGPAAYYVDMTVDAVSRGMASIAEDQDIRQKLIMQGRERSRWFSWDQTTARTKELLLN